MQPEPDVRTALSWWPKQRNVWTPIGWKDHQFRFNVVYNGIVIAEPCPSLMKRPHAEPFRGKDFQLTFAMYDDGDQPPLPRDPTPLYKLDQGFGIQGWRQDLRTPVLWTEWPSQAGLVMRQEIFAHVPGAPVVRTGVEPLYAWLRLSVVHVDEVRAPDRFAFGVGLSKVWVKDWVPYRLDDGVTLRAEPEHAAVPGGLTMRAVGQDRLISEGAAGVRLAAQPGEGTELSLADGALEGTSNLRVELPVREGAHVDLLLAMTPQATQDFQAELDLGWEGALAETEPYWSASPETAARVHVPEPYVDEMLQRSLQFAEVVAETNPENGEVSFLTGSYGYDCLWATPTSMVSHMFLDLFGYHDVVARHSEIFHANQGSVKPPGQAYEKHPGYLSTPKTLTSFDWMCDHGAVLHQLAYHALLTDDEDFIAHWIEPIVRACDFIKDACATTGHDGVPGLLPPAVATDELLEVVSVWNQGWCYLGLRSSVRLLHRLGHPRAGEFAEFAEMFKQRTVEAYRARAAEAPRWTDPSGVRHPVPQANLVEPAKAHPFGDLVLLDAGAMFLVYTGLMDAADPLMRSAVEFFRVGPNTRLYGLRPNPIDRPVLIHEQSSGEQCYSWNIFHSWQLGDRSRYLEGMYGLLTGGISDQTYIASEHRHGMYGNLCATGLITWLLRHAVIDDSLAEGELHLLRLCPLAWLSDTEDTYFERMPTLYGPVSLRFRRSGDELLVTYDGQWRREAPRVVVHRPPVPGLRALIVNGQRYT
ncbi:hypothetical protein [Flindersiella endophytica]